MHHFSTREEGGGGGGASADPVRGAGRGAGGRHVTTEEAPSSHASLSSNEQVLAIKNAFRETTEREPERVHAGGA